MNLVAVSEAELVAGLAAATFDNTAVADDDACRSPLTPSPFSLVDSCLQSVHVHAHTVE